MLYKFKNNRKRRDKILLTKAEIDFVKTIISLQTKTEKLKVNYATDAPTTFKLIQN